MRPKLLDEVSTQELMELRNRGFTNKQIAEQLDVTPQTIRNYIGRQTMARQRTNHFGDAINEMLDSGARWSDIQKTLGCSKMTVYRYAKKRGAQEAHVTRPVLDEQAYAACKAHIEAKKAEAEPTKPKNRLKVENIVTRVTGEAGGYTIDQSKREVSIDRGVWRFDELAALLGDIEAIRQEVRA